MDKNKLSGYLNIAHKAGYLIIGGEKLYNYNKKLYLVLYDSAAQKNTMKVVQKLRDQNIECAAVENLEEMVHITHCKIVGIKNKALSDIILKVINE